MGRLGRLLWLVPSYLALVWWGLLRPRFERGPHVVHQAAVLGPGGVLLALRRDLQGWELPGGEALADESGEQAVRREVREETGLEVEVEAWVGEYRRTGFRPHTARVYRCRVRGGAERPSDETARVAWFDPGALPGTLFPWYRGPLADALAARSEPVRVQEHQGWRHVLAGFAIDVCVRWTGPGGGSQPSDCARPSAAR